jgi:hypothetical protein
MSKQLNKDYRHVYAIVRIDDFQGIEVPLKEKITITKLVWSQEKAIAEVDRLNNLHSGKQCTYFWQMTRLENE